VKVTNQRVTISPAVKWGAAGVAVTAIGALLAVATTPLFAMGVVAFPIFLALLIVSSALTIGGVLFAVAVACKHRKNGKRSQIAGPSAINRVEPPQIDMPKIKQLAMDLANTEIFCGDTLITDALVQLEPGLKCNGGELNTIAEYVTSALNGIGFGHYTTKTATVGACRNIAKNQITSGIFFRYKGKYGDVFLAFILAIAQANVSVRIGASGLGVYVLSSRDDFIAIGKNYLQRESYFLACCDAGNGEGMAATKAYVGDALGKGMKPDNACISVPENDGRVIKNADEFLEWATNI
jgi:hypothetical protein